MSSTPSRTLVLSVLVLIGWLFVSCSPWATADEPDITAIQGGDLYTITHGIVQDGVVLIQDGKIWKMGRGLPIPEGAEVIHAEGKAIMPGMVAATAEIGVGPFGSVNKIADSLDPFHYNVSMALAGGITTAFVSRGGPGGDNPIGGTNAVIKMTQGDLDSMLIKEPAAQAVDFSNAQWMRKHNFVSNLRKAQGYEQKLAAHQRAKGKQEDAPKKPSGIDPYLKLLRGELPARLEAAAADDLLAAAELADEFGLRLIIENAIEAWTVAEYLGRADISLIITPRDKRRPVEEVSVPSGSTLENAAILRKAGVPFAIVPPSRGFSTSGIMGRDLITLPMEVAYAIQGGLDEKTALESITITAARILGVADRVGSLQIGKDADILILDGPPFHYNTFVEKTLVNGKVLYDKSESPYFSHIDH